MMPMRVHSASHSSMECDVSSTVWPEMHIARVAGLLRLGSCWQGSLVKLFLTHVSDHC